MIKPVTGITMIEKTGFSALALGALNCLDVVEVRDVRRDA